MNVPDVHITRPYVILLDPAKIDSIQGPMWVAWGLGIRYILPDGFPSGAVIVLGDPTGMWEQAVRKGLNAMSEIDVALRKEKAVFAELTTVFTQTCRNADLHVMTTAADKHGSVVWEAGVTSGGRDRYLYLSLTPDDDGDYVTGNYHATVSIRVSNGTSSATQVCESWKYRSWAAIQDDTRRDHLEKALTHAWHAASHLAERNLTEEYPAGIGLKLQ